MIPFFKIGHKFIYNQQICNSIEFSPEDTFITTDSYFGNSSDNVIFVPGLLGDYDYMKELQNYSRIFYFKETAKKLFSQLNALREIKISINSFDKFIPEQIIFDYAKEYDLALKYIFDSKQMQPDYPYLKNMFLISEYIKEQTLYFDNKRVKIFYNPFTQFGRFGLRDKSFNILSLHADKRRFLRPESNDFIFYEYDYNAFEMRTLLAILRVSQPDGDLYDKLHQLCSDELSRGEFKKDLIIKLYSGEENKTVLAPLLSTKRFYEKYPIKDGVVENIFKKKMSTDRYHLFSRVLQSSAAYIFSQQIINLINFIETMKLESKVSFCIHDSVCISVHRTETKYINIFKSILEDVYISELNYTSIFPCRIKSGENYGELQQIEA